jgi:hypothetical protein
MLCESEKTIINLESDYPYYGSYPQTASNAIIKAKTIPPLESARYAEDKNNKIEKSFVFNNHCWSCTVLLFHK